jgi:hypothetical protein
MLNIPPAVLTQFEAALRDRAITRPEQLACTKWLRYYLDFCWKYILGFTEAARP